MKKERTIAYIGFLIILFAILFEIIQWKSYPLMTTMDDSDQTVPEWQYAIYVISPIIGIILICYGIKKLIELPTLKKKN